MGKECESFTLARRVDRCVDEAEGSVHMRVSYRPIHIYCTSMPEFSIEDSHLAESGGASQGNADRMVRAQSLSWRPFRRMGAKTGPTSTPEPRYRRLAERSAASEGHFRLSAAPSSQQISKIYVRSRVSSIDKHSAEAMARRGRGGGRWANRATSNSISKAPKGGSTPDS